MKSRLDQIEEDRHFSAAERMLGKLEAKQGNELKAYEHYARALKYREDIPPEARNAEDHAFIAKCNQKLSIYSVAKYVKKKEDYLQAAIESYVKIFNVPQIPNTPEAYANLTKLSNNQVVHHLQQGAYDEAIDACDYFRRHVIKQDQLENFDTLLRNGMFLYWKVWDALREIEEIKAEPYVTNIIGSMMELALEMKAPQPKDCHFLGFIVLAALLSGALSKCDETEKNGHFEFVVNAFAAAELENTDDDAIRHNALMNYLMYVCFICMHDKERMSAALKQAIALHIMLKEPNEADLEIMALLRHQAMPELEEGGVEAYQAATEECAKRMINQAEDCVSNYLLALEEVALHTKTKKRPAPMAFFQPEEEEDEEAKRLKLSPPPSPPSSCPSPTPSPSPSP